MNVRAFFGFLFVVLLTVVLFIIAISLARRPIDSTESSEQSITERIGSGSDAVMTVRGRIVGNESFRGYRLTITERERLFQELNTYDNTVVRQQSFPNTAEAFNEFTYALDRAGLEDISETDLRGICASGRLYTYEYTDGADTIARSWRTSCGGASRNKAQLSSVFEAQFPQFQELVKDISL